MSIKINAIKVICDECGTAVELDFNANYDGPSFVPEIAADMWLEDWYIWGDCGIATCKSCKDKTRTL